MAKYIELAKVTDALIDNTSLVGINLEEAVNAVCDIPAADVVERDEGIRIGAELAAMHGSDATSQELEKAYFDGMEEGFRKARKTGKWVGYPECLKYMHAYADDHIVCSACEECFSILDNDCERFNFCPHCGADMREES